MIRQSLVNNDVIQKKFKILRTSIMLGNIDDREETIKKYEETAREIDEINKEQYEEVLASKMYTATSLEEEKDRLTDLISFIENRVQERNDFIDDYMKITSRFLDELPKASMENELSSLRIRHDDICRYLGNTDRINKINTSLEELRNKLEECYENKANNEIVNSKLEDDLINEFNKFISRSEYYSSLNYMDIDSEIDKLNETLNEKKDVMSTFISSYEALKSAGISGAEREEYLSYVGDSKKEYYDDLEKKYVLEIYKCVLDKENDYDKLYEKRLYLDNLFENRNVDRNNLEIYDSDELEYFISLCDEQLVVIKSQKINIENIDKLILEITNLESELEELVNDNNSPEILDLLNEFNVAKVKVNKLELPKEEKIHEEVISKNIQSSIKKEPNMVVKITEPVKLNVKTASDTAKLVMKKVVVVLEPKKFGNKKDKLKEAEKELEERKKQEKLLKEKKSNEELEYENIFPLEDNDLVEKISDIGINLDTQEVFNDANVKETKEVSDVKIHVPSEELSIPTEIFIEEPKEEKLDLFKETDPFLDDNQFETNSGRNKDGIDSKMPRIFNIGTVKPNNMLSKIEEVQKENDNIILPTMGLANDDKEKVAIVSENYIN